MQSFTTFLGRFSMQMSRDNDETVQFAKENFDEVSTKNENDGFSVGQNDNSNDVTSGDHSNGVTSCGVDKPLITAWDAGWNVSNAIQGMFVLGLPYAVLHGGYMGLFLIIFTAVVCYYTGKILIECLYEDRSGEKTRIRSTYVDVAITCWGGFGGHVVNIAQLIELLMTCVLYVVVSGNLMTNSFPHAPISEAGWSVIATLFLFPFIFLRHLRAVSRFSMACSVAQIVVLGVTMIYCVTKINTWAWKDLTFSLDTKEFPISIGVIVFSYTSQIFLPSLEGSMEKRGQFNNMLFWSYLASCATKALFALICFLTWSDKTKDVVTDNLPSGLRAAVNTMLVVKALLSYPLPYYLSLELIEQSFFTNVTGGWGTLVGSKRHAYGQLSGGNTPIIQSTNFIEETSSPSSDVSETEGKSRTKSIVVTLDDSSESKYSGCPSCYSASGNLQPWALVLRGGLVLGTLIMGVFIPHFALLMGLTGSLTGTSLAFLLPCAFHLQIKWKELKWRQVLIDVAIFVAGLICALTGIYYSIIGLSEAYHPGQMLKNSSDLLRGNSTYDNIKGPAWFPDFPKEFDDFPPIDSVYDTIALPGNNGSDVILYEVSNNISDLVSAGEQLDPIRLPEPYGINP